MKESLAYHQILDEGRLEKGRADTLVAVEERFGAQNAARVAGAVNALEDLAELGRLHRLAIRCSDIDAFRQGLEAATPQPTPPRPRRPTRRRR